MTTGWIDQVDVTIELPAGPAGAHGTEWITGTDAPASPPDGDQMYLDTKNGIIYEWVNSAWVPMTDLKHTHNHGDIYLKVDTAVGQTVAGQVTFSEPVLLPGAGTGDPSEAANKGFVESYLQSYSPERMLGASIEDAPPTGAMAILTTNDSWDDTRLQGIYHQVGGSGLPAGIDESVQTMGAVLSGEADRCVQLVFGSERWFTRTYNGTTWSAWRMLGYVTSDNAPGPGDILPAGALWIEY